MSLHPVPRTDHRKARSAPNSWQSLDLYLRVNPEQGIGGVGDKCPVERCRPTAQRSSAASAVGVSRSSARAASQLAERTDAVRRAGPLRRRPPAVAAGSRGVEQIVGPRPVGPVVTRPAARP